MRLRVLFCLALLVVPFAAVGQQLPGPAEFYFDEDARTTRPVTALPGDDEATQQRLLRMVERNERNSDLAHAQLAHIAMNQGHPATGRALYDQLLESLRRGAQRNSVQWNYGWDLLRNGDPQAALEQWKGASMNRRQNPEWVPPTFALALWRLDRHREARQWYAAAVRTWPDRWVNPDLDALLPDWRGDERAALRQVYESWVENPPPWP